MGGGGGDRPRKKRGRPRTAAASRDAARPKKESVGKEMVTYRASPSGGQPLQIVDSSWTPEPGKKRTTIIQYTPSMLVKKII